MYIYSRICNCALFNNFIRSYSFIRDLFVSKKLGGVYKHHLILCLGGILQAVIMQSDLREGKVICICIIFFSVFLHAAQKSDKLRHPLCWLADAIKPTCTRHQVSRVKLCNRCKLTSVFTSYLPSFVHQSTTYINSCQTCFLIYSFIT